MTTITLYDRNTGELRRALSLPEKAIQANVPEGMGFVSGRFDGATHCVDIETGTVVDRSDALEQIGKRRAVQIFAKIAALEASQHRAMRELALNPRDDQARARLIAIDNEIAKLRPLTQPVTAVVDDGRGVQTDVTP